MLDPNALQPMPDPPMMQPDITATNPGTIAQNPMDQRKRMMMAQMLMGGLGGSMGPAANMLGMIAAQKAAQNTPYTVS